MPLRLEDLKPDAQVTGLIGREAVRIVSTQLMGEACDVVYKDGQGNLHSQILFRDREADLELVSTGRKWSFQGDGDKFRLVSEGERIRLSYLFDPYVAVSSSAIDPLPHQISAVNRVFPLTQINKVGSSSPSSPLAGLRLAKVRSPTFVTSPRLLDWISRNLIAI